MERPMGFYNRDELPALGLRRWGNNVLISRKASIYNPTAIELGNSVRIDDFCVLSAGREGISIGDFVHVAVFSSLIGNGHIALADYVNISSRVSIYSSNDDYSGRTLTNPMVPADLAGVGAAPVRCGRHVIVGSGSVILPGVTVGDGAAVGALSLVKHDCESFGMYAGVPARRLGDRRRDLLDLEKIHRARLTDHDGTPSPTA
jgi:galactoside O-acetyltransferase